MKIYHWKNIKSGATGPPWSEEQYQLMLGNKMLSKYEVREEVILSGRSFAPPEQLEKLKSKNKTDAVKST